MKGEKYLILFTAIYGWSQLEMRAVNLVGEDGRPLKAKKQSLQELETIAIYNQVSEKLKNIPQGELQRLATKANEAIKKLVNKDAMINNYLLAMMLYREWLDEFGSKPERIRFLSKTNRQIAIYEELEGEEYKEIRKHTYRVANNLYRQLTGRPQLDDSIRDKVAERYMKGVR